MSAVRALRRHAALIAIFVIALSLRSYHLSTYPKPNQTADEYAWTWAGLTLVTRGVPRSWSWLPPYGSDNMTFWRGNKYRIVAPWLDHPPLFPLAIGAWMRSFGYKDPFSVDLWLMRLASLVLFVVTFWLLAAVLARLSDRRLVLLTLLIYAVCPLAVFNGRLVVAENLFVPIHLAILYLLLRSQRRRWLAAIGAGAVALPLTKVAAVAMSVHLGVVAWIRNRRTAAVVVAAGTTVGALLYLLYGHHFGTDLFRAVVAAQAKRFAGFDAFWELLFNHKIVEDHAPYLLFLLGLCALIGDARSAMEWTALVIVYGALICFFADGSMVRGWYLIPILPALCYGVARHIATMWDETGARAKLIWVAFAAPQLAARLVEEHANRLVIVRYGYLAVVMAAMGALLVKPRVSARWSQITTATLVVVQVLSDVSVVLGR